MRAMIYLNTRFAFNIVRNIWNHIYSTFRRIIKFFINRLPEKFQNVLRKSFASVKEVTIRKLKGLLYKNQNDNSHSSREPIPNRHDVGGGDYVKIGDAYLEIFKCHGLQPDMKVLDVGCGKGRMARPIKEFFEKSNSGGTYKGFDIVNDDIAWCESAYAKFKNFEFKHSDVYNERYNKDGKICAQECDIPYTEERFDFVFLLSVFTHMTEPAVENYFKQIAQVLKPGGICIITWFLLDEVSRRRTNSICSWFSCRHLFKHPCEDSKHSQCEIKDFPEAAIAYDMNFVEGLYKKYGLKIDIKHGHWARPSSKHELQDLIVAYKPKEESLLKKSDLGIS